MPTTTTTTTTTTTPNLNEQTILGTSNNIGFIGGGQMGYSISVGMAKAGKAARENIYVSDINTSRNEIFKKEGITNLYTDPKVIAKNCNIIFLCTKPHDCTSVLDQIKDYLTEHHLIVSIAAGIKISDLQAAIGKKVPVIRVMPNNCCLVGASASVYCLGQFATTSQGMMLESLTSSLGLMARTEEKLMDTFTGFTGSGPAYVYLFIQALADGAVRNGVKRELAIKFAAQTVYGAAKLVLETNKHPAELVDSVMTPAGTTAEGILVLEKSAFKANIVKAVTAATKRSSDLGAGMGAFKYNLKNELQQQHRIQKAKERGSMSGKPVGQVGTSQTVKTSYSSSLSNRSLSDISRFGMRGFKMMLTRKF